MCRWKCYLFHLLYFKILKKFYKAHSQYKLGKKINSEFPWRIESQMLYHWATETLLFSFCLTFVIRWKKLSFSISLLTKDEKKMIINPVQSRVAQWRIIFSCGEQLTFHQSSLTSRTSHKSKNGRFDQILSNWVNVNGFDDFGQFFRQICQNKICSAKLTNFSQIDWSEINSAHLTIRWIFAIFVTACISGHYNLNQCQSYGPDKGSKFLRKLWCCVSGRGQQDNFVLAIELRVNGIMRGKCLKCQHRNSLWWPS